MSKTPNVWWLFSRYRIAKYKNQLVMLPLKTSCRWPGPFTLAPNLRNYNSKGRYTSLSCLWKTLARQSGHQKTTAVAKEKQRLTQAHRLIVDFLFCPLLFVMCASNKVNITGLSYSSSSSESITYSHFISVEL